MKANPIKSVLAWPRQSFILTVFWLIFSTQPVIAAKSQMIELSAFNYPPFYFKEEGRIQGIAVDIINEVFQRLELNHRLNMYPLKRALRYLEHGDMDGMMILIKTPEREKYLQYTDPVTSVRGLIWSSAARDGGAVEFDRFDDLLDYRIGVTRGYSYGKSFDAFLKKHSQIHVVNTDLQNYKMLIAGRVDIFPGNEIVAKGLFRKHPELRGRLVHARKSFIRWVLHMGISRQSEFTAIVPNINQQLAKLKANGFIDRTIKKYTD